MASGNKRCADRHLQLARADDLRLLTRLVTRVEKGLLVDLDGEEGVEGDPSWLDPFRTMLYRLTSGARDTLNDKQRSWVKSVYERVFGEPQYENLVSSGKAPRGREVKLLIDEMPHPLKPPGR